MPATHIKFEEAISVYLDGILEETQEPIEIYSWIKSCGLKKSEKEIVRELRKQEKEREVSHSLRPILYSPDYGAGWVSWHGGPRKEQRFMLSYQPFVDFLLEGETFPPEEGKKYKEMPIVKKFLEEFKNKFNIKEDYRLPFLGGLESLKVIFVSLDTQVRIDEYDGAERIIKREDGEWL